MGTGVVEITPLQHRINQTRYVVGVAVQLKTRTLTQLVVVHT